MAKIIAEIVRVIIECIVWAMREPTKEVIVKETEDDRKRFERLKNAKNTS